MKIDLGPVTRLEGHLNVHTTINNNRITDARCVGEMFRGFEIILRGRDPLDAQQITQRICGVCPYAHGIAASYAQEDAYGVTATPNGRILHNLIQGANHLYDYLLHFYQLSALDFVDVTAVLKYSGNDTELSNVKSWVKSQLASGQPFPAAPFLPRLAGNYIKDTDTNIGAIKHYLDAMAIQQKANRASAIFGGKFPHATAIFPGGCTQEARIDLIVAYQSLIEEVRDFYHKVYIPDLLAVAAAFPEYWEIGASKGGHLSYGVLPVGTDVQGKRLLAGGVLLDGTLQPVDFDAIKQDVRFSRYSSGSGLKVRDSELTPAPKKEGAYSWIKAPRYAGKMMEVGAAARVLIDYHQGNNPTVKKLVDHFVRKCNISIDKINSVLGRHLCRAICGVVIADFLLEQSEKLNPGKPTMARYTVPESGEGFGATEASRGALLHYVRLKNRKIDMYECVVPTTWNASPRDDRDQPGAMESALIGTKVKTPDEQMEAVRVIHSFDPCLACAVH